MLRYAPSLWTINSYHYELFYTAEGGRGEAKENGRRDAWREDGRRGGRGIAEETEKEGEEEEEEEDEGYA